MAEETMTVEKMGKEFDRQVGKKQRLENELSEIATELIKLHKRISKTLQEVGDPWK